VETTAGRSVEPVATKLDRTNEENAIRGLEEEMSETKSPQVDSRKPYEKPAVATYPSAQILKTLGPALAGYGDLLGGTAD